MDIYIHHITYLTIETHTNHITLQISIDTYIHHIT